MNKRTFLKTLTALGFSSSSIIGTSEAKSSAELDFNSTDSWDQIRAGYKLKPDYINLENGYYCFLPEETLEKYLEDIRRVNYQGSYYMRTVQWENKEKSAHALAKLVGAKPEEIAITRNTTESLDLIISGFPWKKGDQAIMANQDYGSMLTMFELISRRHGVKQVRIDIPLHPENDQEIVSVYENAITEKTKLLMVPHVVNITGQILPVGKISDMAHRHGVEVMVDGAHAVGHFQFSISDLNCDYYGSSLHKWLSVPLGAGLLFVKEGKADQIKPLLAPYELDKKGIYNLNHTGTHPVATDLAVMHALDFHEKIGGKRKEDRLRFLQKYWSDQLRDLPGIVLNTPKDPSRSCAIANVGIESSSPADLAQRLVKEYQIFTVAIDGAGVKGCRITPNLYTHTTELDQLVHALKILSGNKS
ncbi:aminotransferase class V-fold PLP-dependent enzyme [Algoriphagus sp.]|uniref:aminotransferase class V-fold PLP-dependent enzyme n=1 Tax=Algoriphagus sp. TaxID=1872435 RepID=UPI0026058F4B|nr:aminotransferase class V-fold PLP-dependent enzyme [Algoriphagus sp.]